MGDEVRIWTSVGSAGTLSTTDLAKVTLDNAVVALGQEVVPPTPSAPDDPSAVIPQTSAVVRYNITPVDGLFLTSPFHYHLQLTYRGTVRARLVQVDLLNGAAETDLVHFDSTAFPPAHSFVTNAAPAAQDSSVMDFVNFAYYAEATLTAPEITIGNPAKVAAVKVYASPNFPG
jgi:hypothetical protein